VIDVHEEVAHGVTPTSAVIVLSPRPNHMPLRVTDADGRRGKFTGVSAVVTGPGSVGAGVGGIVT
jgi:hypothetical protein